MKKPLKDNGFTLIELMLFTAILSVLLVVFANIFVTILQVRVESEATSAVIADGRYILSRLSYDIHRATNITTPASVGATGSSIALTVDGETTSYAVDAGSLNRTDSLGVGQLNSFGSSISNFSVTRLGNASGKNTLRISFTLTSTSQFDGRRDTQDFNITLGRR